MSRVTEVVATSAVHLAIGGLCHRANISLRQHGPYRRMSHGATRRLSQSELIALRPRVH